MEESDTSVTLEREKPSGLISVEEAAKRLGLDAFTVYSFIQRDRLSPILDDEGVFLVSEEEVNQLAQRRRSDQPC
jgi:predicted site-specific integrase-resolvase